MEKCFFGLVRCYLRVDSVIVRIVDTRICHIFGTDVISREFIVKEETYPNLLKKGFKVGSEWSLSPNQSDMVNPFLESIFTIKDKLVFNSK